MSQSQGSIRHVSPPRSRLAAVARGALISGVLAMFARAPAILAAEVHSNSLGGGDWSDPASWREKTVPTDQDQAVISRGDVIEFDRDDEGRITCQQIYIDPKGTLSFKSGIGRAVCRVGGLVESYGRIKIDASRSASDHFELQLLGRTPGERTVKLLKNSSLLASGRRDLSHGKHNVVITAPPVDGQEPFIATIEAGAVSTVELRAVALIHIGLMATNIDNTGAKANERLNIAENHFTGLSHAAIRSCDSPAIVDNLFEAPSAPRTFAAILVEDSPLAEIRGNVVRGEYATGIAGRKQVDSAIIQNVVENCVTGVHWRGTNVMIKQLALRGCDSGLVATAASGVFEDLRIERCRRPYFQEESEVQLTNAQVTDTLQGGAAISLNSGTMTLLNCNLKPEQILLPTKGVKGPKSRGPTVLQCLDYLVVHVRGRAPAGAVVDLRTLDATIPLAPGAVDPNVRNSPAKILPSGFTPLPSSLDPLIVKSWGLEREGETVPAPRYTLSVTTSAAKPGDAKPLVSLQVTPDESWFRAEPNAAKPTLEVTLP